MRILLTGATGFIGGAFLRAAIQEGHHVGCLVRPGRGLLPLPNTTTIFGALNDVPWGDIDRFRPNVCVHTAWIATPGVYLESPENESWLNWSENFLEKLPSLGVGHITVLGTCIEYQVGREPLSEETTPIAPVSLYARCKNQLRLALQDLRTPLCWGRVFYPYGPGEHPARLASSIIQKLSQNQKVILKTPVSTKDYIFIDDLASAILAGVENRFNGPINFGTGQGIAVRTLANILAEELGKAGLIEEVQPEARDPFGYVVANVAKLHNLGWSPKVSLRDGLKKLIASVQVSREI